MRDLEKYRQAIREVLDEYASLPRGELSSEAIFDEKADRYLLMALGWEGIERVHYCVAHIEIIDGKVWISERRHRRRSCLRIRAKGHSEISHCSWLP